MLVPAKASSLSRRAVALFAAIALLTLASLAGPLSAPASAANFNVTTAEDFYAAIDHYNDNNEGGTIYFDGPMEFSSTDVRVPLTSDQYVIIDGNSNTVSCVLSPCDNWLTVDQGVGGQGMAVLEVEVTGFEQALNVIDTDITIIFATFEANGIDSTGLIDAGGAALTVNNTTAAGMGEDGVSQHDVLLNHVHFIDNSLRGAEGAATGGAAVIVGDARFSDVTFVRNEVHIDDADPGAAFGGALVLVDGESEFFQTVFSENSATSLTVLGGNLANLSVGGGAVALMGATADFERVDFTDNVSSGAGGALLAGGSTVEIEESELLDNAAETGGAIMADDTFVDITHSQLTGNEAQLSGGAAVIYRSLLNLQFSTVSDNDAPNGFGGGVAFFDALGDVRSNLFTGNTAATGGGLSMVEASVDLVSTTLTANTAGYGAAFHVEEASVDAIRLTVARNTLLDAGPTTAQIGVVYLGELAIEQSVVVEPLGGGVNCLLDNPDSLTSDGYNVADDTSCAFDHVNDTQSASVDAMFGPLQFNGGPTWTMLPAPESVLVDAVDLTDCNDALIDQRDVEGERGPGCDIGAVETFAPIEFMVNTPGGVVAVRILNAVDADQPTLHPIATLTPAAPAGVHFPYGALGLVIEVHDGGWPADIEMGTLAPTNQLWKLMWDEWFEYPSTTEQQEEWYVWKFRLIDGWDGDEDGDENAEIIDPVALGGAAAFTG